MKGISWQSIKTGIIAVDVDTHAGKISEAMIASLLLYGMMLVLAIVGAGKLKNKKQLLKKMGLRDVPVARGIAIAVVYVLILFSITIILSTLISSLGYEADVERTSDIIVQISIIEVMTVLIVASFVEEFFFRGFLQTRTNLWVAAAVFAFFHIGYGSFTEVIGAFVLGAILGIEFKRTKSLFSPILTHLMYNLITVILMFSFV